MSWLKSRYPKELTSHKQVAAAVVDHQDCPRGWKADNVSNKLAHADRGHDVDYWLSRKGRPLLPVLANVLGWGERELQQEFERAARGDGQLGARVPFVDFPDLPAFDPASEPLPTFLPGALQTSLRVWWKVDEPLAPALLRAWIRTQRTDDGAWTVQEVSRWNEVDPPQKGGLLVVLGGATNAPEPDELTHASRVIVVCSTWPPGRPEESSDEEQPLSSSKTRRTRKVKRRRRRTSVATQSRLGAEPSAAIRRPTTSWELVELPATSSSGRHDRLTWQLSVLDWVSARAGPQGGLTGHRDLVAHHLRLTELADYGSTVTDLVGLLGLMDLIGADRVLGEDVAEESDFDPFGKLIKLWIRQGLQRLEEASDDIPTLLRTRGDELLLDMEAGRLSHQDVLPLSRAQWATSVPEWARVRPKLEALLSNLDDDLQAKIRAELHTEAIDEDALVGTLIDARLLRRSGSGYVWAAPLVAHLLYANAWTRIAEDEPAALGPHLLSPKSGEMVMLALAQMVENTTSAEGSPDWSALESVVAAADPTTPEGALLADAVVRVLGGLLWHQAPGAEQLPAELLQAAWDTHSAMMEDHWGLQRASPRITFQGSESGFVWTVPSGWFAGRLCVSHRLQQLRVGSTIQAGPDAPWGGELSAKQRSFLEQQLKALVREVHLSLDFDEPDFQDLEPAIALGTALWADANVVLAAGLLPMLFQPALIVRAVAADHDHPELKNAAEAIARRMHFPLSALTTACGRDPDSFAASLHWCAHHWFVNPRRSPLLLARDEDTPDEDQAERLRVLWGVIDPAQIPGEMLIWVARQPGLLRILPEQVLERLADWSVSTGGQVEGPLWAELPVLLLERHLFAGGDQWWSWNAVRSMWRFHPDLGPKLFDHLVAQAHNGDEQAGSAIERLISSAKGEHRSRLVSALCNWWVEETLPYGLPQSVARDLLQGIIRDRMPAWRDAWTALYKPQSRDKPA